jgi:hypothetical protein
MQGVIDSVKSRCHFPSCTAMVTLAPLGGLGSVKLPSTAVNVDAYAGGAVHPQLAGTTPVCGTAGVPTGA